MEAGIKPKPDRESDTWSQFIERHGKTLWSCDFFSVRTVTQRGLRQMYVLVFLCMESREVIASTATEHPNAVWVSEQTNLFLDQTANRDQKPSLMIHDRDTKFGKRFVQTLKDREVRSVKLPICSPNLNGRCERVIQTIKMECLEKFLMFGKRHLDYLVSSFVDYYNLQRAHSQRQNLPPLATQPEEVETLKFENDIQVRTYVGGLVKSFERRAA